MLLYFHCISSAVVFLLPLGKENLLEVEKSLFINIHQLDALNFIITLFQASTCFEHMCSSSGGQNCIIQSLVLLHLYVAVPCTD